MAWIDIQDGEIGSSVRNKLNAAIPDLQSQINSMASGSVGNAGVFSITGSGTNAITGTYTGLTYYDGLKVNLKITTTNTAAVTVNFTSQGVKSVKKLDSTGAKVDILSGDFVAGKYAQLQYDGTDFVVLQILNFDDRATIINNQINIKAYKYRNVLNQISGFNEGYGAVNENGRLTAAFVNNTDTAPPLSAADCPKVLRLTYNQSTAGNQMIYTGKYVTGLSDTQKMVTGVWVKKSELLATNGSAFDIKFDCYNNTTGLGGVSVSMPLASIAVGYSQTATSNGMTTTCKVEVDSGAWIFISAKVTSFIANTNVIRLYFRILSVPFGTTGTFDMMNWQILLDVDEILPFHVYFSTDVKTISDSQNTINNNYIFTKRRKTEKCLNLWSGFNSGDGTVSENARGSSAFVDTTDNDGPYLVSEVAKLLRFTYNQTESGSKVCYLGKSITGLSASSKLVTGAWFKKSELQNLPGTSFDFRFESYNVNTSIGGTSVSLVPTKLTAGYVESATANGVTVTCTVEMEFGDWIYISAKANACVTNTTKCSVYFRINSIPQNGTGTIDILNWQILRDIDYIMPGFIYPESSNDFYTTAKDVLVLLQNPLSGKIAAWDGDSICHGTSAGDGLNGYAGRIATANSMTYTNYGISGGTIAAEQYSNAVPRHWICRNVSSMRSDADYIIFEGGTNDADLGVAVGALTSGYTDTIDDTTFYGALESLFRQAIIKYQGKKLGFIVAQKMGTPPSANRRTYFDHCILACKKYGIPYLDLWNGCHLNPSITEVGSTMYTDGQHLTAAGYDYIAGIIQNWMKTL